MSLRRPEQVMEKVLRLFLYIPCSFVTTQNWTDMQTDRQTDRGIAPDRPRMAVSLFRSVLKTKCCQGNHQIRHIRMTWTTYSDWSNFSCVDRKRLWAYCMESCDAVRLMVVIDHAASIESRKNRDHILNLIHNAACTVYALLCTICYNMGWRDKTWQMTVLPDENFSCYI